MTMQRLVLLLAALIVVAATALAFPLSASAAGKDEFHLYNWNNYLAPETVKRFEEFCKCAVVQTYYSDNEELLAKLSAGAKGYDMYVPTSNAVQALIKSGRLKAIDKAELPNLKNIEPRYLNTPFDPGNKFSVPYAMSTTIIGYNDQKIKELGLPTDTWAVIFDPKHLEKIKGRVTVLDSANELFAAALKYLGYSANDVDPKHWDEAVAVIKKAKPYWAAFNASSYIKELTVGNIWLVHGYSNDIFQANLDAQAAGRKFRILQGMPKEGAVLAVDNMVIDKSAPRPDLAVKFMNFMLEGQNSAELTNLIGSGNPTWPLSSSSSPSFSRIRRSSRTRPSPRSSSSCRTSRARNAGCATSCGPGSKPAADRARRPRLEAASAGTHVPAPAVPRDAVRARDRIREPPAVHQLVESGSGHGLFPVRPLAAAMGPLRLHHQRARVRAVRVLRRPDAARRRLRCKPAHPRDCRGRTVVARDGIAADVLADAGRERRRPVLE
jgi:spermidine/putrescine transport system substrate-binding protein